MDNPDNECGGGIALAFAMRRECRALSRHRPRSAGRIGSWPVEHVLVAGVPTLLIVTGVGAGPARRAAEAVLPIARPRLLLICGFACSLSDEVAPGDVVVARRVRDDRQGDELRCAEGPLGTAVAVAVSGVRVLHGTLLSVPRVLSTTAEKRDASRRTGAVAADMESAALARAATAAGIPFLCVRAVTDGAHEALPLDFGAGVDAEGRLRSAWLVRAVAARPGAVLGLLSLARRARVAERNLKAFLEQFCGLVSTGATQR